MAETPMVEAVARAICRTRCQGEAHPCDLGSNGVCKPGFCLDWRLYAEGGSAAIAAMRNPGPTVIAAVENMAEERYNAAPDMLRWYGEDIWAAGIDAALAAPDEDQSP